MLNLASIINCLQHFQPLYISAVGMGYKMKIANNPFLYNWCIAYIHGYQQTAHGREPLLSVEKFNYQQLPENAISNAFLFFADKANFDTLTILNKRTIPKTAIQAKTHNFTDLFTPRYGIFDITTSKHINVETDILNKAHFYILGR